MSVFKPLSWRCPKPLSQVPTPRSGHRIISFNGQIYTFGGYNPQDVTVPINAHLFQELWKFNLITNKWQKIEISGDIPTSLASHSAKFCWLNKVPSMIVYGGTGVPFGIASSNDVYACNLDSGKWQKLAVNYATNREVDEPDELYGQAVCLVDNRYFYTVGGTSGREYFMDVHRLDLHTGTWKLLRKGTIGFSLMDNRKNDPGARYRHEIVEYDNKIYLFGGGTATENDGFDEIYMFDLETNTWDQCKTLGDSTIPINESIEEQYPASRKCHTCVQSGNSVYLLGGYNNTEIFQEIWRLDLDELQWCKMQQSLQTPVYFHDSTLTEDGKIVIFGGVFDIEENKRTNVIQTCYVQVPSLRQMAWETINQCKKLDTQTPDYLQEEGIPKDLIGQLFT